MIGMALPITHVDLARGGGVAGKFLDRGKLPNRVKDSCQLPREKRSKKYFFSAGPIRPPSRSFKLAHVSAKHSTKHLFGPNTVILEPPFF